MNTKLIWKKTPKTLFVELDQSQNNRCDFIISEKIMTIPDKEESYPLKFNCDNLLFAEKILSMFLQARNKKLKEEYYKQD